MLKYSSFVKKGGNNMKKSKKIIIMSALSLFLVSEMDKYNKYMKSLDMKPLFNYELNNEKNFGNLDYKKYDYNCIKEFECKKIILKYSSIYNIKYEIVEKIVSDYTDDFKSEKFQTAKSIKDNEKHDSYDYEIIMLINDLIKNPSNYNVCYEDIKLENKNNNLPDIKIRDFVIETSNILGLDPMMMLSISSAESYYYEAAIATNKNNPFALRSTENFNTYENIYQGILAGELTLKKGYIDNGLTTYEAISRVYCPSSDHWLNLVLSVNNELEKGRKLFDEKEEYTYTYNK